MRVIGSHLTVAHLQQDVLHPQLTGQRQSLPHPPPPVAQMQAEFWHGAPFGPHLHPLPHVHLL